MAGPLARVALAWLCGCTLAWAQPAGDVVTLVDQEAQREAAPLARAWVDPGGDAGIGQVSRPGFAGSFQPIPAGTVWRLPPEGALWLHLRLQRGAGTRHDWLLKFPMPILDRVTVYQQDSLAWRAETAGDTLPVRQWPERGRYPIFRLDLPAGEVRDVYVRIQHATPAQFPVQLVTAAHHSQWLQVEYLGLGAAFGALLLLIAGCLAKAWVYRDREFAWYALYAAITSLAVASFTGVAAHLLWPGLLPLEDAPTPMLACAAVGAAMLFVRDTLGLRRRLPLQDRLLFGLGIAGLVLAWLPAFTSKAFHLPVVGLYVTAGTLAAVLVSSLAWRRGDAV
ncbi:MAG TPA: 7TM-DISM domain-containing protein, partial [Ramlibacter sp.]|nr:7TM-DISM domain-containing protein [Ramlibacter sp.]